MESMIIFMVGMLIVLLSAIGKKLSSQLTELNDNQKEVIRQQAELLEELRRTVRSSEPT